MWMGVQRALVGIDICVDGWVDGWLDRCADGCSGSG